MLLPGLVTDASFWLPKFPTHTTWMEHAPFAFWLVEAHRPKLIVELGTFFGFSYSCFCQSVQSLNLDSSCFAIDTWKGDDHQGHYGEEVFEHFNRYHEAEYSKFSRLIRSTFDEALESFSDKSIDLLHIDGGHLYEEVKHDFTTWAPKLSDDAVVLFHDTQVRDSNFGVYRFWEELRSNYQSFEFVHCYGLGVLGVGRGDAVAALPIFQIKSNEEILAVRSAYETLGASVSNRRRMSRLSPCPCGSGRRFKNCHGSLKRADL